MSVSPDDAASSTASDEGAETAARIGMPAITAFCTSSKLARPDTCSTDAAQRQPVVQHRPADDLVDGVVPADVFAQHEQFAGRRVEERGGVQSAGLVEDRLLRAQRVGEADEGRGIHRHVVARRRRRPTPSRPRRSTPCRTVRTSWSCRSCARGRGRAACTPGARRDVEHVVGVAVRRRADRDARDRAAGAGSAAVDRGAELVAARDDALGDEEAGREFDVVARGAHRDRERQSADADLERLLDRERVGAAHGFGADRELGHGAPDGDSTHVVSLRARARVRAAGASHGLRGATRAPPPPAAGTPCGHRRSLCRAARGFDPAWSVRSAAATSSRGVAVTIEGVVCADRATP